MAISGDTVVAGAPDANVNGHSQDGAAYVFVKPAGGWASATETAKLTASDGATNDALGQLGGGRRQHGRGRRAVRLPRGGVRVRQARGRLDQRDRNGQADRLRRPPTTLGFSVGVSGDTVVAGAFHDGERQ